MLISLDKLKTGESMMIQNVGNDRLRELGFEEGERLDKLYTGFSGNPVAVRVCGSVFAVRREDAEAVIGRRL